MQLSLDVLPTIPDEAYAVGVRSSGDSHGVVLTKPHIVRLILDLVGYHNTAPLHTMRLLEPSCGEGVFVLEAVRRLLASARGAGADVTSLASSICAVDIDVAHVETTRHAVRGLLIEDGASAAVADALASQWIKKADALLYPMDGFDFVVGNPPYVRIEQLSPRLQAEYRQRFHTLYDRADLYVAFIERGLSLLTARGALGFICADRWTLNKYGGPLRELIARSYRVRAYVDLHSASPFDSEVTAYPSIFALDRTATGPVPVAKLATAAPAECEALTAALLGGEPERHAIEWHSEWFSNDDPWLLASPSQRAVIRTLEAKFPPLEASATVGIGVATGSDSCYIVGPDADIEPDRLVPLIKRADITDGQITHVDRFVINTFDDQGRPVDLDRYPRLARYLDLHRRQIAGRHVAKKNQAGWFRTIDRVYPALTGTPKLLIPDIASSLEVTFDHGRYYPHHNLYFVTSDLWDLEVLGGLLSSDIALSFIQAYAVRMRGGYLRFQAQYLRRIRVPEPASIKPPLGKAIKVAFRSRDREQINTLAQAAYGLP